MRDDASIWPTLLELTECLEAEFADEDFCFIGIMHGQAAPWDYGPDGMAWVRLTDSYHSTEFPNPIEELGCAHPLAHTIEVGALRCAPMPDDSGTLPGAEEQEAYARTATADMAALRRAIMCCLGERGKVRFRRVMMGDYTPLGPMGGTGGGMWTVTVTGE